MSPTACPRCGSTEPLKTRARPADLLVSLLLPLSPVRCDKCRTRFRIRSRRLLSPGRIAVWLLLLVGVWLVIPHRYDVGPADSPRDGAGSRRTVAEPPQAPAPESDDRAGAIASTASEAERLAIPEEAPASAPDEPASSSQRIAELEAGAARLRAELASSKEELERLFKALAAATAARDRCEADEDLLARQNEALVRRVASLLEARTQASQELASLKTQLEQRGLGSVSRERELESELASFRGRVMAMGKELRQERALANRWEQELARQRARGDLAEAELTRLRDRLAEVEADESRRSRETATRREPRQETALTERWEQELARQRVRGDRAEAELARARARLAQMESGESRLRSALESANAELEQTRADLETASAARDGAQGSGDLLGRQKELLERKLASLMVTHRQAYEELGSLKTELERRGRESADRDDELRARLAELDAELASVRRSSGGERTRAAELEAELERERVAAAATQAELERERVAAAAAQEELDRQKRATATARQELERERVAAAAAQEELAGLREQAARLASTQQGLDRVQDRAEAAEAELATLRDRLAAVEADEAQLRSALTSASAELERSRLEVAAAAAAQTGSAQSEQLLRRQNEVLERKLASLLETHRQAHEELGSLRTRMAALEDAPVPQPAQPRIAAAGPAPGTAPEPAAHATTEPAASEVRSRVDSWARAWSDQDVEAYLSHYAESFVPAGNLDVAAWRRQRRQRVSAPGSITVSVDSLEVSLEGEGRATAVFRQSYRSDTFADEVIKTLELVREAGTWRIVREASRPAG